VLNGPGLPPRAGSEHEGGLRAYGADRYVPTDAERYASNKGGRLCTQATALAEQLTIAKAEIKADLNAKMDAMFELIASRLPATPAPPPATPTATPSPKQKFLEEQELWLAEDHIAFGAASRIQDDEDETQENELLCVQAVHSLVAQERPCAQDKDSVQYLEQENDGLRIQAGTKLDYTVAVRPGVFCERKMDTVAAAESETGVFCEREMETDTVAAAEPETGVREMDTTAAAKIFAVVHQDHYISKSTAADAPTGSTLNEPESRAFTTDPRPHALRPQERQPHRLLPRRGQGWPPRSHPD